MTDRNIRKKNSIPLFHNKINVFCCVICLLLILTITDFKLHITLIRHNPITIETIKKNNMNYSTQFQRYNSCAPRIVLSGGFGNRVLSYWHGRSSCFWNDYICNTSMYPDKYTIANTLPTISFVNYSQHKINSPPFLSDICSFCNDLNHPPFIASPWESKVLFCFYNKWFMNVIQQETHIAFEQYYMTNELTTVTNKINITQCDIAIHIRCGDHLNYESDKWGLFTSKFYTQSINYLLLTDNMRCLNKTVKSNIFIVSQLKQKWFHQGVTIHRKHGREGRNRMIYICDSYTKRIGDILSYTYNHSYTVKYTNNHAMNDLELMTKVPFLITTQSTFSMYAALTRIDDRYYTILPPSRYRILSINDHETNIKVKQKAFESAVIPVNHFLFQQLFNVTVDNYNQYCITTQFMGKICKNYLNISSPCNQSDLDNIIRMF
eukprot:167031_1